MLSEKSRRLTPRPKSRFSHDSDASHDLMTNMRTSRRAFTEVLSILHHRIATVPLLSLEASEWQHAHVIESLPGL